jgi:PAS domain S-box-containing protein
MKIRTQLIVSIALFVLALLLISASVIITNQQVDRLKKQEELINSIQLGAGELGYLSNDYILYPESPQLDRWNSKYASLSEDLSKMSVDGQEQQVLLDSIKADQQRLKEIFDDVVSTIGSTSQNQNKSPDPAYIQLSWSRIALQTRGMVFDASRLSQMLNSEEKQATQTNTLIIFTMMGAFVAFLLIDYIWIYGRTIKSIENLQAGTNVIGSGNLDYSIKVKKGDEIGDLAQAINQMTTSLKTVTASKADLEKEVAERKRAEEKISHLASFPNLNPNPVIETDLDGNPSYINPSTNMIFPDLNERGAGHPILAGLKAIADELGAQKKSYIVREVAVDGSYFQETISIVPDRMALRIYALDITKGKQAEMAREQLLLQLKAKTSDLENANEELAVKSEELTAQTEEIECTNEELRCNNEELQRITRSLCETKDFLEKLINYANAPIIVWDPKFTITRFNHAFERLSGYTANEIIGKDLGILFPQDSSEESLEKIRKTLMGEQWESVEIPILHKSGGISIVLWNSANIYGEDNSLLATIAQGQDITTRKQAEKELEEAKSQAELYLDLMGHDISNMHQIIMTQLELSEEIIKIEGRLEGEDKELIDISIRTLEKAAKLIDNVRKLQKLRSGEYGLEAIDLSVVLEDVLNDYSSIQGRDVTIKYTPDGVRLVRANALLKDVFNNVVHNAVKHSSGPLTLVVNISSVDHDGKSYYRVTFEDNGGGIPDDKKEEIFHRFKRGQTQARGTGLGLYLVKSLVEGFGGYVEIQNRVLEDHTKGTRFLVYLPVMEEKDAGNE